MAELPNTTRANIQMLILGTADWNQPIATNQHSIARELGRSFNVTFVESLGLRRPQLTRRDFGRAMRRLLPGLSPTKTQPREVPEGVTVVSPRVIPFHRGPIARFNKKRLRKIVAAWRESEGAKVLWTYSPVTYGLEEEADATVYHLVDLLGSFPGISAELIDSSEAVLKERVVRALGSSRTVVAHLQRTGFTPVEYWPNVAELAVFAPAHELDRTIEQQRRAVFAGNLSDKKIDQELLQAVIASGVELHLAGPVAEGGKGRSFDLDKLVDAGATYHGLLAPSDLADLFATCGFGLIPYRLNAYTEGVYPLKAWEYLAAGMVVVSTALPSMIEEADGEDIFTVRGEQDFLNQLHAEQDFSLGDRQRRANKAASHGWAERGQNARRLVEEVSSLNEGMTQSEVAPN
ncbi:glycosyltransferase [Curtobacterium citreum]|uniref:glycosyltransferase n=1 Tax=Curtobacterium citreum TaxID=2036 RepID=UPI00254A226C|nr:glycosyltransferase [Curtobacterium citreum]MDK8173677.1 glycosyltransferase [Curtobacterium citreum]